MRHERGRRQIHAGLFKAPLHNDFRECFKLWMSVAGWCVAVYRNTSKRRKCRDSDITQTALFEPSFVMT